MLRSSGCRSYMFRPAFSTGARSPLPVRSFKALISEVNHKTVRLSVCVPKKGRMRSSPSRCIAGFRICPKAISFVLSEFPGCRTAFNRAWSTSGRSTPSPSVHAYSSR